MANNGRVAYIQIIHTKKISIIGGPTFHRDGFSDSIFGWVIVDDLTDLGQHAQLHIFRQVTAGPPINFNLLGVSECSRGASRLK